MPTMTRRSHLTALAGATVALVLPRAPRAQAAPTSLPAPTPAEQIAADRRTQAQAAADAIPPQGIGTRIRHVSYSDLGGRPDTVQVMVNRGHLYVGHMFSDGVTVLDARDPRALKPVHYFATPYTRTHHLQVAGDYLLLANGANLARSQSYDNSRDYFENTLADSLTKREPFRAGLSIFDVASNPAEPREIAFLEMPGIGVNRLWWTGGRYAYVSAHFDGFTDHVLCIVDLQDITKPAIASRWWLPGMHRAGGETPGNPPGKRFALHHMIVAGNRGYGAWRDGGFTIHDVSDASTPKLLAHLNWSPPFPGGTHTPLPLPSRGLAIVADESNADFCAKGLFHTWVLDVRAADKPARIAAFPTPTGRDFCAMGNFGPHNLHENRPGSFVSEETIFATYHDAGVRVFDVRDERAPKEIASWIPPPPTKLVDPRPNVARCALTCDCYVAADGLMYVTDWNAGLHVLQYEG
jgi:hypothetical protein